MFNPERLSLIVQPVGDGGLRFYSYQTDDAEATVTGAGYATNAADYGLRTYDLIFVSPLDGAADTYILAVDTIDADGHATLASPGPIGDLLAANNLSDVANAATALANLGGMAKATYDPGNVAGDAFAMDNMVEGADTKILTAAERAAIAALGTAANAALLDEDDFASNSATGVPSQQSVNVGKLQKALSVAGVAALSPTLHSGVSLVGTDQDGEFTPFDNTGGTYNSDLTDDVNSGFVFNGVAPYVWVRRPDWYLDGEHFRLGATADDTDAMQGFLNIAARRGRVAMLPPTQVFTDTVTIPSDIHILGRGRDSVWSPIASLGLSSPMFTNGSPGTDKNITLENFDIDGQGLWRPDTGPQARFAALCIMGVVTNLKLKNVSGHDFGYNLFGLRSCIGVRVRDCEFYNIAYLGSTVNGGYPIWFGQTTSEQSRDILVAGCYFHDNDWHAIQANGHGIRIVDNFFWNNKEAHIFSSNENASTTLQTRDLVIARNRFIGLRRKNISAHSLELGFSGGLVVDNIIEDADHGGIALSNIRQALIARNIIRNVCKDTAFQNSGIDLYTNRTGVDQVSGVEISHNRIYDTQPTATTQRAIQVSNATGTGAPAAHTIIHDNHCSGWTRADLANPMVYIHNDAWTRANCRSWNNFGAEDAPGTYTPTLVGVTNIDALVPATLHYRVFGNQVDVWGPMQVDPTAGASTGSEVGISLPIASNLTAITDLNGFASASTVAQPFRIEADPTNDRAKLVFSSMTTANMLVAVRFSYEIK